MMLLLICTGFILVMFIILVHYSSESFTDHTTWIYDTGIPGPCIGVLAGMHGNEPAACYELKKLIDSGWFSQIKRGSVRIIPIANPNGLRFNMRNNFLLDMNRQFHENGPMTKDAAQILYFFKPCDVVIDFHEGWGFHQISPESLGSTIMPNSSYSQSIANQLVHDLNQHPLMLDLIAENNKKAWVALEPKRSCEITTTLSCYYQQRDKNHILVETTGQNNIQSLNIRQTQVRVIVTSLLQQMYML
jgi:hypothetical protein